MLDRAGGVILPARRARLGHREEAEEAADLLLAALDPRRARLERLLEWELAGEQGRQGAGVGLDRRGRLGGGAPAAFALPPPDNHGGTFLARPPLLARPPPPRPPRGGERGPGGGQPHRP